MPTWVADATAKESCQVDWEDEVDWGKIFDIYKRHDWRKDGDERSGYIIPRAS